MALMEVVLQQTFAGQEIVNRWNYVSGGTPASVSLSFALVSALGGIYDTIAVPPAYPPTRLMRLIAAMQSVGVTFDFISARDVYSVTDFYETPFTQPLTGAATGDSMPPYVSIGYRTNRIRTDIRRGTKRFTGVPESGSGSTGVISGSTATQAAAVGVAMSSVLTYDDEGNTLTFSPTIVGRESYPSNPAYPDRKAYRYYEDPEEQMEHLATGIIWDLYPTTRSQTSRQVGRGR